MNNGAKMQRLFSSNFDVSQKMLVSWFFRLIMSLWDISIFY